MSASCPESLGDSANRANIPTNYQILAENFTLPENYLSKERDIYLCVRTPNGFAASENFHAVNVVRSDTNGLAIITSNLHFARGINIGDLVYWEVEDECIKTIKKVLKPSGNKKLHIYFDGTMSDRKELLNRWREFEDSHLKPTFNPIGVPMAAYGYVTISLSKHEYEYFYDRYVDSDFEWWTTYECLKPDYFGELEEPDIEPTQTLTEQENGA